MSRLGLIGLVGAVAFCTGCESTGGVGSVLGGIVDGTMQGVNQAVGSTANEASAAAMGDATNLVCGGAGSATCRSMTSTMLTGFTTEFIKQMTARDLNLVAEARDRSIQSGQIETWQNPETGASGYVDSTQIAPLPPAPTPVKVQKDRVESLPVMDAVGEEYVVSAAGGANMRSGPGTAYPVVEKAKGGQKLTAIAKVQNENWYLVGRESVATGYVFGDLIKPAPRDKVPEIEAAAPTGSADTAAVPEIEVEEVSASIAAECYTTTQKVTLNDGTSEQATITSCRTPNGWAQV